MNKYCNPYNIAVFMLFRVSIKPQENEQFVPGLAVCKDSSTKFLSPPSRRVFYFQTSRAGFLTHFHIRGWFVQCCVAFASLILADWFGFENGAMDGLMPVLDFIRSKAEQGLAGGLNILLMEV